MLTHKQRIAILELHRQKVSKREIARQLKISRGAVKKVIRSHSEEPPKMARPSKVEEHRQEILRLYPLCRGNLVRVHEKLLEQEVEISYPALTAFCRKMGIGRKPRKPAGRYHFEPGQEMQHDTSPHRITIGGRQRIVQTAAAILCVSRMLFCQFYPRFRRFECKVFLTETLKYLNGVPQRTMIDNTHVVVLRGTGAEMIPVPEMEAFSERFGFRFQAHEKGDANRSAHVERALWYIETNFLAGRTFTSWNDLNQQARHWCDQSNARYRRHLKARPVDLYAVERIHLKPLPLWIPEPYQIHHRTVDVEGYVSLDTNRYSVPSDWIGRPVQVRETQNLIEIESARQPTVVHSRVSEPCQKRSTLPEHRSARGQGKRRLKGSREEKALQEKAPELSEYIAELKKRGRQQTTLALRQLLRMVREYPRQPLLQAVKRAAHYGLYDLDRVECMVLRCIASDYFLLGPKDDDKPNDSGDDS